MPALESPSWDPYRKLVRTYSYVTLAGVLYGVAWAHAPFLVGEPWSTCKDGGSELGCVLVFHLFELPTVVFFAYVAWYGLRALTPDNVRSYSSLLVFAATAFFVFFAFEIQLLLASLERSAPTWEVAALASVALILLGGAALTMYVHQRLVPPHASPSARGERP
jgi:hypothetical protein